MIVADISLGVMFNSCCILLLSYSMCLPSKGYISLAEESINENAHTPGLGMTHLGTE